MQWKYCISSKNVAVYSALSDIVLIARECIPPLHMLTLWCAHTQVVMPVLLQAKLQQREQREFVSSWLDQQPLAPNTRHPF